MQTGTGMAAFLFQYSFRRLFFIWQSFHLFIWQSFHQNYCIVVVCHVTVLFIAVCLVMAESSHSNRYMTMTKYTGM